MSILLASSVAITAPASSDGLGEVATLNDSASGTFVGYLWKISGFGGPGVRTSTDDIPEGHGSVFGSFFHSHRPFTLEVSLARSTSYANSDARYNKLCRAWNAMAGDGSIVWTDTDSIAKRILFRREQAPSDADEQGHVLLSGMAANPRIESNTQNQASPGSVTNAGNVSAPPTFVLTSPTNTITLTNSTYSETLTLTGLSGAGTVTVDFGARTVTATSGASNRYSAVSFPSSVWWELRPGAQTVAVSGATATSGVRWRDSWLSV
jgi:hypothetical protein